MSISVRDLLRDPELSLRLSVAGDLDRPIRWVHVTELADASPYLAGDELLLTAGVWRDRGTSDLEFVRAINTRQVAAVGYGLLQADASVPEALVKACEAEGVPLLVVPVTTPFIAIAQRFVQRMTEEREAELQRTLSFTSELLAAADTEDPVRALGAVVGILTKACGHDAWIADAHGHIVADTNAGGGHGCTVDVLEASRRSATNMRAIRSGSRTAAYIGLDVEEPSIAAQARLEAAAPVAGLLVARQRAVQETERRLAGEVVSLVLSRQVQAAAARMQSYGVDPALPSLAMVAGVTDGDAALTAAEAWRGETPFSGIVALRGSELYVVLGGEALVEASAETLAGSLVATIHAEAIGIGSVATDVTRLRKSMVQARQACLLALRRGGGMVLSHESASSHTMLLALQDQDVLDSFRDTVLAPLEAHDERHGTELLETARTFLKRGGRLQATADELEIHVNTVRYRLAKVEEITGRSLDDTANRVDLWLALHTPAPRPQGGPGRRDAVGRGRR